MATPEVTNTEKPIIEIQARDGTKHSFRSLDELQRWLDEERTFWSFLSTANPESVVSELWARQMTQEDPMRQGIARGKKSEPPTEEALGPIRNWLSERYHSNLAMMSDSPAAKYIKELVGVNLAIAAHAMWQLEGHGPRNSNTQAEFSGRVMATLFQQGIGKDAKPLTEAWSALQRRATADQEALRVQAGSLQDKFENTERQIGELHEQQRKQHDEAQARRETEFKALYAKHTGEMDKIQATFKKDLSLRSAVDYLTTRSRTHRRLALGFGIAAGVAAVAVIGLAVWIGKQVFAGVGEPPRYEIAVAALIATLAFWFLRILVRVFLSNLHLSTDMRTRATFVHTYLALIAEGGAIKDEDRAMIIGLVFRPTSDGLVRDDATPPGLWDLLTKRAVSG